jgi:hypothetical protein
MKMSVAVFMALLSGIALADGPKKPADPFAFTLPATKETARAAEAKPETKPESKPETKAPEAQAIAPAAAPAPPPPTAFPPAPAAVKKPAPGFRLPDDAKRKAKATKPVEKKKDPFAFQLPRKE